ncbi:DUF6688 domain-containing protein [Virgibacillus saliphilus]|uniref:DUF6688 domain-containing protein n=1 Tax=Virgibacillus saliphilus TaxID=2831674 RepID=UPI002102EEDD|nr:DUF6688 family protein [Virgibacillus sp. NKC19-3]
MSMFLLIIIVLVVSMLIYPFVNMVKSFTRNVGEKVGVKKMEIFHFFIIYFLIFIGLWANGYGLVGGEPLHYYQYTGAFLDGYASLNGRHISTVLAFLLLGILAYWMLSIQLEKLSPILYVVCSALLVLTILFTAVYIMHTGFTHYTDSFFFTGFSIILLQTGFVALSFLYIARLKSALDYFSARQQERDLHHTNRFMTFLYRIFFSYRKMPVLWVFLSLPVLLIIQFMLLLFGQRPDSFIRVFLDTSSFNYSNIPAPKPEMVEGDGHYLCTVSARGHKKLVKPVRAGVRHGNRIVVNRQLLIANAFENILEEYMPNCHRAIRMFYDRYGYPLSKHIKTKTAADMVYLFMKPLEWFFLFVLYSVDKNPENRICMQYSELRGKGLRTNMNVEETKMPKFHG